ncbi:MAG: hypothetical protein J6B41_02465 [Alistipes sp.]|nr:hypothetical protein [Alistipes sp.]
MKKMFFTLAVALFMVCGVNAQDVKVPHKVSNLTLIDLEGAEVQIPNWGKKNLLIFYVDPDESNQNHEFTVEMEENHKAAGDNIYGFGIINLKDSWYPVPDSMVRKMARKRTEKNGAYIITDPDRRLAEAWDLGTCNNKFVLMIVSKQGELVYCHKGEISEAEKQNFYKVVQKYR